MVEYRRATEAERRRYGVEWRVHGSAWRTQLPAWSHTVFQGWCNNNQGAPVSRSQQAAERRNHSLVNVIWSYAKAMGIDMAEAQARVQRQRDIITDAGMDYYKY